MPVTFADVPLCLPDPGKATRKWLRTYIDERYASIFCVGNTAINDLRHASVIRGTGQAMTVPRVGLPVGNYPSPPRPRINSVYHPTGALRWTSGLFLVDKSSRDAVLAAVPGGESALFVGSDSSGGSITLRLRLLPPRPISAAILPGETLWLLPLVDERYFWQQEYVTSLPVAPTWDELLGAIAPGGDVPNYSTAVASGFGVPDPIEWNRDWDQTAMLIEAIAQTLIRRVIRVGTGVGKFTPYDIQDATSGRNQAEANLAHADWGIIAGGEFSDVMPVAARPAFVNVATPHYEPPAPSFPDEFDGTWDIDSYAVPAPHGAHSRLYHSVRDGVAAATVGPEVLTWLDCHYDVTYAGIVPWVQNGCDDYVRWDFTTHSCQTRAVSMPPNFGCDNLPARVSA